ncbi:hypothetical protein DC31_06710 [Microbacterium sp. CH12i]|nr:hypothetical protein DC31_06710 [Microbacterium sp. CH12i]
MFARKQLGEALSVLRDEVEELQHHPGALLRVRAAPGDLRLLGVGDRGCYLGIARQRNFRLHLSGTRVEHVTEAVRRTGDVLAADEVGEFTSHFENPPRRADEGACPL